MVTLQCVENSNTDQCEWEPPQACQGQHRQARSSTGRSRVAWKGNQNQDPLPLQLVYYMSQAECVFHVNSEFLMNGQTSCKPFRPEALILPTVYFLDGLPLFRAFVSSQPIVDLSEGVWSPLFATVSSPHVACVLKLACLHLLFKCVCVGLLLSRVKWERTLKERKTPPAFARTCLSWPSYNWDGRKKSLNLLISCHLFLWYKVPWLVFRKPFDHIWRM